MSRRRRSVVVGQFGDGNGDKQLAAEGVPVAQKIRTLIHCLAGHTKLRLRIYRLERLAPS